MNGPVRIGTRGSALALAQAQLVAHALEQIGAPTEIVVIETAGDRRAPDTPWGEGAFVAAIQHALLEGRADVAVHSAKDVPTDELPSLVIAAYLEREDARDALVLPGGRTAVSLDELPAGATVGTDSPRRTGFLRAARSDLTVRPIHGNVDTRLRRLDEGAADALILAVAGLARLGRGERVSLALDPRIVPPAPGQGAIAVEVRADDARIREIVSRLDHGPTRAAVEAERAVLRFAGGGCRSPIGALGTLRDGSLHLLAGYASTDGSAADVLDVLGGVSDGERLAAELVARLDASVGMRGAGRLRPRILVTRPAGSAGALVHALESVGLEAVPVPTVAIGSASAQDLEALSLGVVAADWVVVTSSNAVPAVTSVLSGNTKRSIATRVAAVGPVTAHALRDAAGVEAWTPTMATAACLAEELPLSAGARVVVATTPAADGHLVERLRERGAEVRPVRAYDTVTGPEESREPLLTALTSVRGIDAITFMSGSAVRGFVALAREDLLERSMALPALCVGPETAAAAQEAGFANVRAASAQDAAAVAALVRETLQQTTALAGGTR